jgi:hypothetical protein
MKIRDVIVEGPFDTIKSVAGNVAATAAQTKADFNRGYKKMDKILSPSKWGKDDADDATTTLLFSTNAHAFTISDELGRTLYCASEYLSDKITCLSDKNDLFRPTDDDGYYYVFKSASSNTISVKNRTGDSRTIQIKVL